MLIGDDVPHPGNHFNLTSKFAQLSGVLISTISRHQGAVKGEIVREPTAHPGVLGNTRKESFKIALNDIYIGHCLPPDRKKEALIAANLKKAPSLAC